MSIGITLRHCGLGDGLQFSSLPENYFNATGEKLVDVSRPWFFDHNPFVDREPRSVAEIDALRKFELWNFPTVYEWPKVRDSVYLSNAEIHGALFGVKNISLIRPRLYRFENYPFEKRERILFHPFGKSNGPLPDHVIDHVVKKYHTTENLFQIGHSSEPDIGIPRIITDTFWDLAEVISQCSMLIGADSGPSWIAACYPDVRIKKIRRWTQFGIQVGVPEKWIPMDVKNHHSFWDDRAFEMFNTTDQDIGFTQSYRRI